MEIHIASTVQDGLLHGQHHYTADYLEDLVVYSKSWEERLQHLQAIPQCIQEAGLTAK